MDGPSALENHPDYIKKALDAGFNVEVDVQSIRNGEALIGHGGPSYTTNLDMICDDRVWCHAKTLSALEDLLHIGAHCFWHQDDDYTITSKGVIWTARDECGGNIVRVTKKASDVGEVMTDNGLLFNHLYGVCCDYVNQ